MGNRPANALGLLDAHGNVGEWTANWYGADALSEIYAKGDLSGPAEGRRRVVRGGSWDENRPNLRSSFRNVKPAEQGDSIYGSIGFRCAYDPPTRAFGTGLSPESTAFALRTRFGDTLVRKGHPAGSDR